MEEEFKMNNIEVLRESGLVEINCKDFSDENLLHLASEFGVVVPGARGELVQSLPAREKGTGPVGSFSYSVGYGQFPWHTDTAYWSTPARYLLLASNAKSPCATTFQSFDIFQTQVDDFDYLMKRAVYLLNVPGMKRYLSPLFEIEGEKGYRMDFHIYRPINEEAALLMARIGEVLEQNYLRHIWTGCNVVVLDNWRIIHARESAVKDKNRHLKRIYINELV